MAYYLFRRKERLLAAHFSDALRLKLAPPAPYRRFLLQLALLVPGMTLALLAVARPQWGSREETVYQRGRDLVIALDVSRSMLARDVHPNRLGRAKADLLDLIREIHGDRVALIAFSGKANLLCPLTTDHTYLKQVLDGVDIDSAPRGRTDIGDAIRAALDTFESDHGSHKAMILISDGEDLSGSAAQKAAEAGERGIPIFAVGLGDPKGARIPSEEKRGAYLQHDGEDVLTRLNHEILSTLARSTGGAYLPVGRASLSESTLGTIYRQHMSRITSQDLEESVRRRKIERFQIFLLPGLLCLLAGSFLSRGRLARQARTSRPVTVPPPLRNIAAGLALLLTTSNTLAQTNATTPVERQDDELSDIAPGRTGARKAQQFYRLGLYEKAAKTFEAAADGATQKSQHDFHHNAAIAYYKAGSFKKSAELLEQMSMQKTKAPFDTEYALGVVQYRAAHDQDSETPHSTAAIERERLLRDSGQRFQQAARLSPKHASALRNLAVVQDKLPAAADAAHVARLMAEHGSSHPFQLADQILKRQREIIEVMPDAFTNDTPERIEMFEQLASLQTDNADLAIPLKAVLHGAQSEAENPPDKEQLEKLSHFLDETRSRMQDAGRSLRDLKMEAYEPAIQAESEIYGLWKGMAPYHPLLSEDITRQTNVFKVSTALGADATERAMEALAYQQQESAGLTRLFLDRFSEAFPEGTPAPAPATSPTEPSTNAPALTPEQRAEIVRLTEEAIGRQTAALKHIEDKALPDSIAAQQRSLELLKQIEALLPQQAQEPDPQDQQEDQEQEQDQKQEDQEQDPQSDAQQDPEQDQQPPQEEPEPEEAPEPEQQEATLSQEETERLLDKVLQREKDYLDEKKRRQHLHMPSLGQDW